MNTKVAKHVSSALDEHVEYKLTGNYY